MGTTGGILLLNLDILDKTKSIEKDTESMEKDSKSESPLINRSNLEIVTQKNRLPNDQKVMNGNFPILNGNILFDLKNIMKTYPKIKMWGKNV